MAPSSNDIDLRPHVLNSLFRDGPATAQAIIRIKATLIILVGLSGLLLTGCNDGSGCDLPPGGRDWLIEVELGHIPSHISEYPFFVNVHLQVRSLETGNAPPDGLVVALTISPGSFSNGETEIQLPLVNGRQSSTLKIDTAGSYDLAATIEGDVRTVHASFTVGL